MGKIEEEAIEESLEEAPKKSRQELWIEEIMAREGDIPNPFPGKKRRNRRKIVVIFLGEEGEFDLESVHSLLMQDHKFFRKYRKYKEHHSFNLCQEPFSYMYEKKCWEYGFFDKLCILLKRRIRHIHSGPFSASGLCPFFEFETLNSPSKCNVYLSRSHQIMRNSLEKFQRAALTFNADYYEADGRAEIIDDSPMVPLKSPLCIRNKKIRMLRKKVINKDEIPRVDIDRSLWPSHYLTPKDRPRIRRDR